ncbi:MAG: hypothetical protein ACTSRG_09915 [Candidatus Helarchaeota archaeon]
MSNEIIKEIQIAEVLFRKAGQILKDKELQIGDLKTKLTEKIAKMKIAIKNKDINLVRTTMDELQVPISRLSANIYDKVQEKPTTVDECDSCQVSFKIPSDLMGPKVGPKTKKKNKMEKEEVVDANFEFD